MSDFKTLRILLATLCCLSGPVIAAPQAQPGDVALRHDLQVLADYGALSGPVTTWPISWDAVLHDLEKVVADDVVLPNKVLPTFDRVLARAKREAARGQVATRFGAAYARDPVNIRGFSNTPREEGEARAEVSWFSEHVSLDLSISGVEDPSDDEDFRADGSQISVDLGNWSIAASTYDRWWGPGWDGSLILSNNARPVPAIVIGRNLTTAPTSKWLSWIGPWDMQVIWGQLEEERAIPDARFFGMRVNFKPTKNLEFGISRTAQWCGDGRPCGGDTFWKILIGDDNLGDPGTTFENEPSNQLAGFDARWTTWWFEAPVSIYGQLIGEDEAGRMPSNYLAQFGIEGSGITRDQISYRWFVEGAATSCDALKSDVRYGCGYRHNIYESGYTFYDRIIGHSLDNDGRVISAGIMFVTSAGNAWQVLGRTGDVNRVGSDTNHSVSVDPAEMASIDIEHTRYTRFGQFDLGIGFERREDAASGVNVRDARGFLRWTYDWGR